MNRNATGLIATGALLSALAGSSRLPTVNPTAPATRTEEQVQENHGQHRKDPEDFHLGADFAMRARRDYSRNLARLFLDVCRGGTEGLEPEPPPLGSGAASTGAVACSCQTGAVDRWAYQAFPKDPDAVSCLCQQQEMVQRLCQPREREFIVALVPDPVHTHLALLFDRAVEVIQETSQDQGFQFVKALTPWDPKVHPESEDVADRLREKAYVEALRDFPGLLAFRRNPDDGRAQRRDDRRQLFVLLVGESPTGGISKQQFLNAIDWIKHTVETRGVPSTSTASSASRGAPSPAPSSAPGATVRPVAGIAGTAPPKAWQPSLWILGPTFSGSLASLAQLLTCQDKAGSARACYGPSVVFSGSVTGRSALERFVNAQESYSASFASFQESDEVMIERFRHYLKKRGFEQESIAVLSEDETEYGAGDDQACPKCSYLYFPREISRLRAAYQGSDARNPTSEAQSTPRTVLPPNLEISGADDDTVAAFSKQSPLSQEGVLLGIVSELRKHAVQFILLRATDPIDLLFLSRYLAAAYPKGRIVTLGADLLFRREVEDKQLHGILALSTYSLAPTANHEFKIHEFGTPERLFPSSGEAGTYNALLALMAVNPSPATPLTYTAGRLSLKPDVLLYQYGWHESWLEGKRKGHLGNPDAYNTPPVHLLALGRDEYWPIAHLGPSKESGPTHLPLTSEVQLREDPFHVTVPISWVAAELVAFLLAFGFACSLWFSSVRSPSQLFACFAPATLDARAALIAVSAFVLLAMILLLLFPFLNGDPDDGGWIINSRRPLCAILATAGLVVLGSTIFDLFSRWLLARRRSRSSPLWWAIPAFAVLVVSLSTAWVVHSRPIELFLTGARRFQVLRSLQLTSGLSPVLPMLLLLAAWIWWAFHVSAGATLLDGRRPRLPRWVRNERVQFIAEEVTGCSAKRAYIVSELLDALLPSDASFGHVLRQYLLPAALSGGALLLLAASAPWGAWLKLMTLESHGFETVLGVLCWLALAGIIGTTFRLWEIWIKARRLLVMLDSLPLRAGFRRLEGFSWKPLWRLGLVSMTEFQRILARVREAHKLAANELSSLSADVVDHGRKAVRGIFDELLEVRRPFLPFLGNWHSRRSKELELITEYQKVQADIAAAAGRALDYLAARWEQGEEKPRRRSREEVTEEVADRACEKFVCLVYVSFLLVVLLRMRTLILAVGGMYVLVLLAMTVYPFQPRAAIAALLAMLLVYIIAVVTLVLAQLHRDATLSNLTNTTPGELGSDFWIRATSFAALPLISFLASQFPQVNRLLYSWLEPALQALNK